MKQYKFCFLILHYQVLKETLACVESIRKHVNQDVHYHIVIVDNASPNGSGKELLKIQNETCTVLCSDDNLGFSGGNNIGFEYAKKELHCDFICMMNNDTEILQDNFIELVLSEYENSHFAVLGPEIHLLDESICQYPKQVLKLHDIEGDRERVKKLIFMNKYFLESIH
ncbi:MAG: glycosyltransferase, partial [Longicatena sp.]